MPYTAPSGTDLRQRRFPGAARARARGRRLGRASTRAQRESSARGKLRGRGIGCYLEVTAPPSNEMGGIRFEADGTVTIITGTLDYGQGHARAFAQVLVEQARRAVREDPPGAGRQRPAHRRRRHRRLEVDHGERQRDRRRRATRSSSKGKQLAAHVLEAGDRRHRVRERPLHHRRHRPRHRHHGARRAAARGHEAAARTCRATLDVQPRLRRARRPPSPMAATSPRSRSTRRPARSRSCSYTMVNDFGTVINPMLVEGQVHGGVVQGIGQALMEHDRLRRGRPARSPAPSWTTRMPRAADAPRFTFESHPVPATTNPLGAKGCGEAGCAGALPSVMNAVVDALRRLRRRATSTCRRRRRRSGRRSRRRAAGIASPNGLGRSHICWPKSLPASPSGRGGRA